MNVKFQDLTPMQWLRERWVKALAAAVLLAVLLGNQGLRSLVRNWLELRALSREIAALEEENARSAARLKEMRESGAALEGEARKVGFIRPGEIEYRFDPPKK
jgi:cell division protein FtsB